MNPREIPLAALGDDILGYVEFHIEQGPVLEALKLPLGVVDAITGQSRLDQLPPLRHRVYEQLEAESTERVARIASDIA